MIDHLDLDGMVPRLQPRAKVILNKSRQIQDGAIHTARQYERQAGYRVFNTARLLPPRLGGDYQAEANDANYSSVTKPLHEATLAETPWAGIVKMRHHEFC
jgi:hypothetical protein